METKLSHLYNSSKGRQNFLTYNSSNSSMTQWASIVKIFTQIGPLPIRTNFKYKLQNNTQHDNFPNDSIKPPSK